jgi:hypothetical protein
MRILPTSPKAPAWRHYSGAAVISFIAIGAVFAGLGWAAMLVAITLSALEITFSFDNAVINAKILSRMSPAWRTAFMTVGVAIAVVGVRLVLPLLLVSTTAALPVATVLKLAFEQPEVYAQKVQAVEPVISAFGGMFLLLTFLRFILDATREVRWLESIERPLAKAGQLTQLPVIAAIVILLIATKLLGGAESGAVLFAGSLGIAIELAVTALIRLFERSYKHVGRGNRHHFKVGLLSFIYLEVMDASFSLDSVIGAFAVTNMLVLIAVGLGIGALWMRALTTHLVEHKALLKYRYLEHGAHYAIGALATILLIGIRFEMPQVISGTVGLLIIGAALFDSWRFNARKRSPKDMLA